MNVDVLNEQELYEKVVSPAISRLNQETAPILEAAARGVVADVRHVIANALQDVHVVLQGTVEEVQAAVRQLDGAKLVLKSSVIQIVIPELVIELKLPKGPDS